MGTRDLERVGSDLPSNVPLSDTEARKEQNDLFGDDLRHEQKKQVLHTAFLWFIRVAAFILIIAFVIRMSHFLLPTKWCWLTEEQLQGLDKFLFSGTLGGLVVAFIKPAFPSKSGSDEF